MSAPGIPGTTDLIQIFNANRTIILQSISVGFFLIILALIGLYFYENKKKNTTKPVNLKTMIDHQILILENLSAVLGQKMNQKNVEGFNTIIEEDTQFFSANSAIKKIKSLLNPTIYSNTFEEGFFDISMNTMPYLSSMNSMNSKFSSMSGSISTTRVNLPYFSSMMDSSKYNSLLNLQPVTVKESGFIGPVTSGAYEERVFVQTALKSGIRSFVLYIDQYTGTAKDKLTFAEPGEPCFLHRNDSGGLISLNSGSILKFSTALAELAFSGTVPLSTSPIILILHGESAPDAITKPKEYLGFYSKVAEQLNPLIPFHLGLSPSGDYHRQGLENDLYRLPFKSFEKKIIILSTIDTELFRNVSRLNIPSYSPYKDLDFWIHAHIVHDKSSASQLGRYITSDDLETLSSDTSYKGHFVIVLPKKMKNLSDNEMRKLLSMGVNIIPLDIVTPDVNDTVITLKLWNTKTWNLKAVALQT